MKKQIRTEFETEWAQYVYTSRIKLGLSQRDFAKRFKIGRSTVQFYENGRLDAPHPDNKRALVRKIDAALKRQG